MVSTAKKKTFKCTEKGCNAAFTKNRKLISHSRLHTGERPFVCDVRDCTKTYTNSSHLNRHKTVKHGTNAESSVSTQEIECKVDGCGRVFANKYSHRKHYNLKHNPDRLVPFKCTDCNRGFTRKKQLQQHAYIHTGVAPFRCDICDLAFTAQTVYTKHKRSHRTYTCNECGDVYYRWSLLLAHRKQCRANKRPRYTCKKCLKVFTVKWNYQMHCNNVHKRKEDKYVYICPYSKNNDCKRFYFYKNNLMFHIRRFHQTNNNHNDEIMKLACTYPGCDKILKTARTLRFHLLWHIKVNKKKIRRPRRRTKSQSIKSKSASSAPAAILSNKEDVDVETEIIVDKDSIKEIVDNNVDIFTDEVLLKKVDEALEILTQLNNEQIDKSVP